MPLSVDLSGYGPIVFVNRPLRLPASGGDPHEGWCGEGELEAPSYPIRFSDKYPYGVLLLPPTLSAHHLELNTQCDIAPGADDTFLFRLVSRIPLVVGFLRASLCDSGFSSDPFSGLSQNLSEPMPLR
jgi:hypothetical protein